MPRDGTKNLKPMNQRSKEEVRKIAQKGGRNSGIARRKKANLKKALNTILTSKVHQPKLAKLLEEMGFENSYETAIVFSMANKATKGDVRAAEWISKLTNNDKDELDKKEQKERIKALKMDNEERQKDKNVSESSIYIIDEWKDEGEKIDDI